MAAESNDQFLMLDHRRVERYNTAPQIIQQLIKERRVDGSYYTVYQSNYVGTFTLDANHAANGAPAEFTIDAKATKPVRADISGLKDKTFCLLMADVEKSNSTCDFALAWSLDLARKARGDDGKNVFDPGRHVCKTAVIEAGDTSYGVRTPLLIEPLLYKDAVEDIQFSSIEAWGFDSTALQRVIQPSKNPAFCYLPGSYRFSYLIARVHVCIKLANARAHQNALYAATMPRSAFSLLCTRERFEILRTDLNTAVEFIETRLLSSIVKYDPAQLTLKCKLFGPNSWTDVFQVQNSALQSQHALVPPIGSTANEKHQMQCTVSVVAYFAILDNSVGEQLQMDGTVKVDTTSFVQSMAPPPPVEMKHDDDNE